MRGRVAIIAGVASGIGKAAERIFAGAGASLMFAARREKALEEIVSSLESARLKADYAVRCTTYGAQAEAVVKKLKSIQSKRKQKQKNYENYIVSFCSACPSHCRSFGSGIRAGDFI